MMKAMIRSVRRMRAERVSQEFQNGERVEDRAGIEAIRA
jgi:hypothetical protein